MGGTGFPGHGSHLHALWHAKQFLTRIPARGWPPSAMGEGRASVLRDPEASWPPGVAGKEVTRKNRQVLRTSEASLWKVSLTHEAEARGARSVSAREGPPSGGPLWKDAWVGWPARGLCCAPREMVVACHGHGGGEHKRRTRSLRRHGLSGL